MSNTPKTPKRISPVKNKIIQVPNETKFIKKYYDKQIERFTKYIIENKRNNRHRDLKLNDTYDLLLRINQNYFHEITAIKQKIKHDAQTNADNLLNNKLEISRLNKSIIDIYTWLLISLFILIVAIYLK